MKKKGFYYERTKESNRHDTGGTETMLVTTAELCTLLSCGRRNAEKIGKLAKAQVQIGNLRRWNVEKIRYFLRIEAM